MSYTFRQYGTFSNITLIGVMIMTYIFYTYDIGDELDEFTFLLVESLLALTLLLFYCLTIEIGERTITLKFGIGIIQKTISIEDIEQTIAVRNKWWYGFGIRRMPTGWMWNISGFDAVEIQYKDSSKLFRIGTADSQELKLKIDNRIHRLAGRG